MGKHRKTLEDEANVFAVLLLIPEQFLVAELEKGINLADDEDMKRLCKMFGVSSTAMAFRISLLPKKYLMS